MIIFILAEVIHKCATANVSSKRQILVNNHFISSYALYTAIKLSDDILCLICYVIQFMLDCVIARFLSLDTLILPFISVLSYLT